MGLICAHERDNPLSRVPPSASRGVLGETTCTCVVPPDAIACNTNGLHVSVLSILSVGCLLLVCPETPETVVGASVEVSSAAVRAPLVPHQDRTDHAQGLGKWAFKWGGVGGGGVAFRPLLPASSLSIVGVRSMFTSGSPVRYVWVVVPRAGVHLLQGGAKRERTRLSVTRHIWRTTCGAPAVR